MSLGGPFAPLLVVSGEGESRRGRVSRNHCISSRSPEHVFWSVISTPFVVSYVESLERREARGQGGSPNLLIPSKGPRECFFHKVDICLGTPVCLPLAF